MRGDARAPASSADPHVPGPRPPPGTEELERDTGAGYMHIFVLRPRRAACPTARVSPAVDIHRHLAIARLPHLMPAPFDPGATPPVVVPPGVGWAFVTHDAAARACPAEYTIYWGVRAAIADGMAASSAPGLDADARAAVDAAVDAFLPLAVWIGDRAAHSGRYDDRALRAADAAASVDALWPRPELAFSAADLPDISRLLLAINWWGDADNPQPAWAGNALLECLLGVLKKARPVSCQKRDEFLVVQAAILDVPASRRWLLAIAFAGLRGVYAHASAGSVRVRTRAVLYGAFVVWPPDPGAFCDWVRTHRVGFLMCLREFLLAAGSELSGFHTFMTDAYAWDTIVSTCGLAMNRARDQLDAALGGRPGPVRRGWWTARPLDAAAARLDELLGDGPPRGNWWADSPAGAAARARLAERTANMARLPGADGSAGMWAFQDGLDKPSDAMVKNSYRPRAGPVERYVLKLMNTLEAGGPASPLPADDVLRWDGPAGPVCLHVAEWLARATRLLLDADGDRFGRLGIEWMCVAVGLTWSSACGFRAALDAYESETNVSRLRTCLEGLRCSAPRDYALLRVFYTEIARARATLAYPLPEPVARAQLAALRALYASPAGRPLHEHAGLYYYCPNCNALKASVATEPGPGWGDQSVCGVRLDPGSGRLLCNPPKSKNGGGSSARARRAVAAAEAAVAACYDRASAFDEAAGAAEFHRRVLEAVIAADEKQAVSTARNRARDADCKRTPVVPINAVGRLLCFPAPDLAGPPRLYAMCGLCTRVFDYRASRGFVDDRFHCGCGPPPPTDGPPPAGCDVCDAVPDDAGTTLCPVEIYDDVPADGGRWRLRLGLFCGDHVHDWYTVNPGVPLLSTIRRFWDGCQEAVFNNRTKAYDLRAPEDVPVSWRRTLNTGLKPEVAAKRLATRVPTRAGAAAARASHHITLSRSSAGAS